ncbi:RNase Sy [Linderina pennispora]|uniref:ribonuclease T2 n=1 Tax=Linderina pennispora TaxID=61395 RepID=A0A1Y1W7R4_9FUNG|nr:RNase Sy [Linderina pennispora]ORX69378.1 RNase Sy [Linderina pennispora]
MRLSLLAACASSAALAFSGSAAAQDSASCSPDTISCQSSSPSVDTCCSPKNGVVVLVQQWFKGLGPDDQFTLHGLWPNTCSGAQTGNNGCDDSRLYPDLGTIIQGFNSTLYDQLNTYWPSYKGDNPAFWSHEWNKHGTCVTTLDPSCYTDYKKYQDVNDYFTKVLSLRKQYDYYGVLAKAGITPGSGKTYKSSQFKAAIKAALGVDVAIKCQNGALNEIWAWFNVQGTDNYIPTRTWAKDSCTSFTYSNKN